ncbi:hypothetical protein BDW22DRAFT_284071 [Trametopsis cervina]|nr:hypothetical protein BDW22DRAFT_284071 [Trametopsis cervina]
MPRARCRYYDEHGAPINGGCRRIGTCGFIHPSEPGWMNAPLSRAMQPDAFSSGMGPPTGPRKRGRPDSGFGTSTTYQDSQPSLGDTTSGSSWGASGSSWTDSTSWQASSSSSARGNVSGSTTWGEAPKTTSSKWGNAAWIAAPTNTSSDWGDSSSGTAPADAWGTQPSGTYSGKGKHKESVGNDKSYARAAGETGSVKRKESANNEKKDTPSTGWGETSWGNDAWIGSKGDTENSSWGDSTAARHDSTTASGWQESTPARQDQPATPHWEGSPGPDRDDPMLSTWEAPAKTHPTESDPWTATHTSNDADLAQMDEMDQTDDSSLMPEEVHQSTSLHRTAEVFLTRPLSPPQPLSERDVNTKRGASPMSLSDLDTHVVAGSSRNLQRSGQSARSRSSSSTKSASVAGKRTFDHQDLIEYAFTSCLRQMQTHMLTLLT